MKLKTDPRHIKRIKLMQALFSWNFLQKKPPQKVAEIVKNLPKIDKLIAQSAKDRPISEINKIDLAILRLAIFELIINHRTVFLRKIESKTPPKVVVDEAVELGKEFGSDSSGSFINGTLGQVIKLKKIIV